MATDQIGPISSDERIEVIDVLRGLAIAGILVGNMQWFSGYGQLPAAMADGLPFVDRAVHFTVHFLIEGKFYSIFSFLFGFGFALQIARAERRGDEKAAVFKRRLLWLLLFGVLHAVLLWAGDILSVYALMGFILLLFKRRSDRSLIKWAIALIIIPVIWYTIIWGAFTAFAPPNINTELEASMAEMYRKNVDVVSGGGYPEILTAYNLPYLAGRWIGLIMQMRLPKILAMFLLGVYAFRKGYFRDIAANGKTLRRVLIYGGILGVIGNLLLAALAGNEAPFPPTLSGVVGVIGYAFGVPALALAIIAAITLLWQQGVIRKALSLLAPVGRMALTNYLLQTVVCIVIFYGYGFGQYGKWTASSGTLLALGVFAGQVAISTVWLRFFAYGPMEWVWRQLTYKRRLPLKTAR